MAKRGRICRHRGSAVRTAGRGLIRQEGYGFPGREALILCVQELREKRVQADWRPKEERDAFERAETGVPRLFRNTGALQEEPEGWQNRTAGKKKAEEVLRPGPSLQDAEKSGGGSSRQLRRQQFWRFVGTRPFGCHASKGSRAALPEEGALAQSPAQLDKRLSNRYVFKQPGGGSAANPARFERKQR